MPKIARDILIIGLRNAHAMERQAQELLERQIERAGGFPELRARLRSHLGETLDQTHRLERCLRRLGESQSTFKDLAMSAIGNLFAMAHTAAEDEILKNSFASAAFEHYEIAAYKSLLALCKRARVDIEEPLQQSLREEEEMAEWLDSRIGDLTLDYLARHERRPAA